MTGDLMALIEAAQRANTVEEDRVEDRITMAVAASHGKRRDFFSSLAWKEAWRREHAKAMELGRRVAELEEQVAVYKQELGL